MSIKWKLIPHWLLINLPPSARWKQKLFLSSHLTKFFSSQFLCCLSSIKIFSRVELFTFQEKFFLFFLYSSHVKFAKLQYLSGTSSMAIWQRRRIIKIIIWLVDGGKHDNDTKIFLFPLLLKSIEISCGNVWDICVSFH